MKLSTVMFVGLSFLSTTIWADFPGHYTCEGNHRGKPTKTDLDLKADQNSYHAKISWSDRTLDYDLLPTKDSKTYLVNWKTDKSLGIAAWVFKDNQLTMHKMFYDLTDGKKHHEKVHCKKN